ncbi:MAG: DNA polymerase III subunit beta [Anaerolineaceae bacterium]|jgi:DNA polymerase-3 subunit beta|nr:DNA polymerase III subunit beta [Anaerolineae bacterium]MBL1171569.1 DNA polymerase III subunit beta [Chloroflexota bacterium]MBV6466952.1 Beta sliding clamp [Anaerolineales bacterium]MCE7905905.1 DNA polymerase III subunit beta [Anaerolineae bacterium CFX3]MDL1925325.1 DNA polymerase III subunit beta [Anaerolineae bacterium AMX1]GER78400.1 DNA polymerase III subunit beta [Candidatus Denitrolinea symbiosum]GJQ37706.1 MAG: DNA polymerase III subunit beta [Anaerolineaceae bacterium]
MKVTVLQENLARGLSVVSRAVSPRSTLPVLANVLIATDEGRLRLSATNLEMGITCWIPARIEQDGSTTVPSRTFSDLVNTLPGDQAQLTLNAQTQSLHVQSGASNNDIKCIDAQEFPPLPVPDMEGAIQLNVVDFKEMIRQVAFAASTDESRPVLMGVLMTVDKDKVTMAAADGFRLSVRKAVLSSPAPNPFNAIIPARALSELARVAGDGEEMIHMVAPKGRGQVVFRVKDVELVTQLIDGAFPDYQQIIPRSYKSRTLVSTASLLKACKQAEIFAREGSNVARLDIKSANGGSGEVEISATSEETGKNETIVEATVDGSGVLIAFNVKFLREVLEVIKSPNVALETSAANAPGVVRPVGDEDFLHVIMPMHLG